METYGNQVLDSQQMAPPNLEIPVDLGGQLDSPDNTAPQESGDFYTPESEIRGEIIDYVPREKIKELEQTETSESEKELTPEEEIAITQLTLVYPELYKDKTLKELAELSQSETLDLVAEAREQLELTESLEEVDPESLAKIEEVLNELLPRLEEMEQMVAKLEKIALNLPKELREQLEDLEKDKEKIEVEIDAEIDEFLEKKSRLQREIAVESFIRDSIARMRSEYGYCFDEAENGEVAQKIATTKLASCIWECAQRFIREGGMPDYSFKMEIVHVEHEDENNQKKRHITEINIEKRSSTETGSFNQEEKAA